MLIKDKIYGEFYIEGVLEELINSKAVIRLKNIHQGGPSYLVNDKWSVTRYDHSIGVMLLIRMLGGGIEEQVAGLLHDVSHTTFSHSIDYALDFKDEDYHEKIYETIIEKSDIPKILSKYNMDYKEILFNYKKFGILERDAPKLCADRVDYTLRDMLQAEVLKLDEIKNFLKDVEVVDNEIVLKNVESALWFVEAYYKEVIEYFLNPLNIYAYDRFAKFIKLALEKKIINLDSLLLDDLQLLKIIKESKDSEVLEILNEIHKDVILEENFENYDIYQKRKLRTIDPSILIDGKIVKASEVSKEARKLTKEAIEKNEKGIYIKIVK